MKRILYTWPCRNYISSPMYALPETLILLEWVTGYATKEEASGSTVVRADAAQATIHDLELTGHEIEAIRIY